VECIEHSLSTLNDRGGVPERDPLVPLIGGGLGQRFFDHSGRVLDDQPGLGHCRVTEVADLESAFPKSRCYRLECLVEVEVQDPTAREGIATEWQGLARRAQHTDVVVDGIGEAVVQDEPNPLVVGNREVRRNQQLVAAGGPPRAPELHHSFACRRSHGCGGREGP